MTAATLPLEVIDAAPAPAFPFYVGQRVVVTTGGRRGETGTVHDIYPRNDIVKVVTQLDSWTLYHGPVAALPVGGAAAVDPDAPAVPAPVAPGQGGRNGGQ
jgi:hypothetical protein